MHLLKFEQHKWALSYNTLHTAFGLMISFVSYFYNIRFPPQGIDQTNLINGGESGIQTHDTFNSIQAFQACAENLVQN